jgi:hypothetical protein
MKSLVDIETMCQRVIRNTRLTEMDAIAEGDHTETDAFYCSMINGLMADLMEDVQKMIKDSQKS